VNGSSFSATGMAVYILATRLSDAIEDPRIEAEK
jgi:hypothetical protein